MSLRKNAVEFSIENKKDFTWAEIAQKFDLEPTEKNTKQLSDWFRYWKSTGNIVPPTYDDVDSKHEEIEFEKEYIHPVGFKVKSAWQNAAGTMLYSYIPEEQTKDELLDTIKEFKPYVFKKERVSYKKEIMLEIFPTDFHINRMQLNGQTPQERCEEYYNCVVETVERTKALYGIDTIVYITSSDFFNSDGKNAFTSNGTMQDNNLHFDKAFELGLNLSIQTIDYLLENCNHLKVINLSGNHDVTAGFYLTKTLEAYYRTCPIINFNSSLEYRKVVTFGNTSIFYHHGNQKPDYLVQQFANFFPKEYCNKFIEIHIGDKHHRESKELGRVMFRQYPTMTSADRWSDEKGYYNTPGTLSQIYHIEKGRIAEIDIKL
jgi:hypothetical protein